MGKVWRIGLMGFSAKPENVRHCLTALEHGLIAQAGCPSKAVPQLRLLKPLIPGKATLTISDSQSSL